MRWHPLGKRGSRGTHEAAPGKNVEGSRSFADEVRWRLEARRVRDAPARKQSDDVSAKKPRGSFGGVASIRVLGQENEKAAPELLVKRSQNERKRGLRNTCAPGQ